MRSEGSTDDDYHDDDLNSSGLSNESSALRSNDEFDYDDISRDDVKEQLAQLGYKNVSDEIVDEFLEELKGQNRKNEEDIKRITSASPVPSKEFDTVHITPKSSPMKRHVTIQGDNSDDSDDESDKNEPETSSDEEDDLSNETESSSGEDEQETESYSNTREQMKFATVLVTKSPSKAETVKKYVPPSLPARKPPQIHVQEIVKAEEEVEVSPKKRLPPSRPQSAQQHRTSITPREVQQSKITPRSYIGRPSTVSTITQTRKIGSIIPRKPINYRKKIHDPVKRYHQLNSVWKQDKFLRGESTQQKPLRWQVRQEMLSISGDPAISKI